MRRAMNPVIVCVSAVVLGSLCAACNGSAPGSPTAPSVGTTTLSAPIETAAAATPSATSPTPPTTPAISNGASISGSVNASAGALSFNVNALTVGLTVRVVGTSIEAAVAGSGYFELKDVPEGNIQLHFSGAGIDAKISIEGVTAKERIELVVAITGSSAAIEKTNRETADAKVDITGKITSIDASSVRFGAGDPAIVIASTTLIRRGPETVPVADLRPGDEVRVKGTRDGSVVRAERIDAAAYKTVGGIVSGLAGACPNLTFTLDGVAVSTEASTIYSGSACGEVKNGEKRSVSGPKTEGRFTARYVSSGESVSAKDKEAEKSEKEKEKEKELTLTGKVSGLGGACPAVTFTVSGYTIKTDASTTFSSGAACSDIKNDASIGLAGTKGADGKVAARYVSVSKSETKAESEITVTGVVSGLTGACPNVKFALDGKYATTTAATIYGGAVACGDIKNGEKWGAAGTKNAEGLLVLRYVTRVSK